MISELSRYTLEEIKTDLLNQLEDIKRIASIDLEIDEIDLDGAVLKTPKLHTKYNNLFADSTISLKNLYSLREKTKLERWKYWNGKQSDRYYKENGLVHEKILKGDLEKYLAADEKLILISEIISIQKASVDYLEKCIKEIQTRNFHCKVVIDWRRFTTGH